MTASVGIRAAEAKMRIALEERACRTYFADALRILTENTARLAGGVYLRSRFADLQSSAGQDVSAEDVIGRICAKLRA